MLHLPSAKNLVGTIQQLLKNWRKDAPPESEMFADLRLWVQLVHANDQVASDPGDLARRLLAQAMAVLQERDRLAANLIQQRYFEDVSALDMARRLAVSEGHYFKLQNEAIGQLAAILLAQEQQARAEHQLTIEARLEPPTYRRLIGVEEIRGQLRVALTRPGPPWLIAIDGLGGIGKTALANELTREQIWSGQFDDIAWISARQQIFLPAVGLQPLDRPALDTATLIDALLAQLNPALAIALTAPSEKAVALTRLLKKRPYLIVIDNLETSTDYQALLPTLHKLAGPSRFLLTTRHSLCGQGDVFCLSLTELTRADTLALLRHEAEARGLLDLAGAPDPRLNPVYEVVGGNPLALKLVMGQSCALPLSQVLAGLQQARIQKISDLYTYIYWQSWRTLAPASRQALLAMPLAPPQGSNFAQLAAISQLDPAELSAAMEQLVAFSLIEVSGDLEERRYRIHRLTETFLLTEVARWPLSP